jgi:hypothetical protein
MPFTGQLGTALSMPGNLMPGGPTPLRTTPPQYPSLRFEVNLDDDPSIEFPPTGYTDLSFRVRGFSTRRGRNNFVDRVEGGVASVLLDNRDGYLNFGQPGRLLLRRARLQAFYDASYFPLFTGHIESYRYSYPGVDHDAVVELTLSDGLKVLGLQQLPASYVREAESADLRVGSVLEVAGIGESYRNVPATYVDTDPLAPVRVTPASDAVTFTLAATLVDGSATITVASTTGLAGGMAVSGTGVPTGAVVNTVTDGTHFTIRNDQDPAYGKAFLSRSKDTIYPGYVGPWYEITGISDTKDLTVGMHVGPYWNSDGALLFDHTVTEVQSDRVIVSTPINHTWRGPSDPGGVATAVPFTASASQTLTVEKSYLPVTGALDHVRQVEATERGLFVLRADGTYEYQGSGYRPAQTVQLTFGENAGEVPYAEVPIVYDDQNVVNEYIVKNIYNDSTSVFSDATSQTRYFRRSDTIEQIWAGNKFSLPADQQVFEPIPRLEGLKVAPAVDPANLWRKTLSLDVSKRVDVHRRPLGGSDIFSSYSQYVEGIQHDGGPSDWRVTFITSPVR